MANNALFVVRSAVTAVTACRVNFAFNFMSGQKIAAMNQFTVGTVAVFDGWFDFQLVGMAVIAERGGMADCADFFIPAGSIFMFFDKYVGVVEYRIGFESPLELLILVAVGADRPPFR